MAGPTKKARQRAYRKGFWAEWIAAVWLIFTGHRIIARRYRTPAGEIDIIAKRGKLIIMVEVKARQTARESVEAVTGTTQKRIHAAADLWLAKQPQNEKYSVRFDIVAIVPGRLPKHFKNMF